MRKGKENFIVGAMTIISNELANYGNRMIDGITFRQWFLLMMISKMPDEEKTLNAIAEFAGSSRQNVKKMLSVLSERGYVNLTGSKKDLRALSVSLTDKAYKYFYENDGKISSGVSKIFADFSDAEVDGLTTSLKKLIVSLEGFLNKHE